MPRKGTKRVKAHTRQKNISFGGISVKDPFSKPSKVKQHYRSKPKKRR